MSKTDGGSAFPTDVGLDVVGRVIRDPHPGMSLRDWFAGQALIRQALFIEIVQSQLGPIPPVVEALSPERIATRAYAIADAMLAERSKP